MALRIFGNQMESIGDFPLVLESVYSTRRHNFARRLRLVPTNIQGSDDMEKQIGRDAARIVPILPETEEAVGIVRPFGRGPKPHGPVDMIVPLAIRSRSGVNRII